MREGDRGRERGIERERRGREGEKKGKNTVARNDKSKNVNKL